MLRLKTNAPFRAELESNHSKSPLRVISRLMFAVMPLAVSLCAAAAPLPNADSGMDMQNMSQLHYGSSPLIGKVRAATAQFRNINTAKLQGWVQGTPCVSGPDTGAMGVHFVQPARIAAAVLQADQPEALIYEPLPNNEFRLVGVEYIILANVWQSQHTDGSVPALDGNLLNYVAAPNRYGLPAFYELHVWAWEDNPMGSYADWNTHVSCSNQSGS